MIEISLTRFLDFTVKSGSPKLTSLRRTKMQLAEGDDPMIDYYKQIRDTIDHQNAAKSGTDFPVLSAVKIASQGEL